MGYKILVKNTIKTRKRLFILIFLSIFGSTFYFLLNRFGLLMPLSELPSIVCLSPCKPEKSIHPLIQGDQLLKYKQPLQEILGSNVVLDKVSILVEKSKHRLTVFYNLQPIKSYPVVFGANARGDKFYEGDKKTPEGVFHVRNLYNHPDWSKFIWLDYPTSQSWRENFQAKLAGKINWFLPIGGEIGIHGVPAGQDNLIEQRSNWTLGCVSLKNDDVNEIYQFLKIGSLIEIVP
ncbi:L,D-transpeptidase family protein [Calothrix sp. PCC 6303]|uniref:L,D-transpeptidase family protein n=1 Tax=Calothrix sp. PCC 6303 TaxID=1170562 RepID=UPI0002A053D0|nr:L,D-transpeptidase [Calothrix sp. PCC 6303]AFZ04381.1 ErfK/YbiS/YcfS/YnhG family protein [Calothrix sp. PCC 6303]